jgi:membrane protease YdiL (CAAX protease family)
MIQRGDRTSRSTSPDYADPTTRPVPSPPVPGVRETVRTWLNPPVPAVDPDDGPARRLATTEVLVVLTVTLGLSALRSGLSLVEALLQPVPLNQQQVALNAPASQAELVDLAFQLAGVLQLVGWGALGAYLLIRAGVALPQVGLDGRRPGRDALGAAGLAALIGVPGLGVYLVARALGVSLTVAPTTLTDTWWRVPVLVASAAANAWAEEVVMVGYLMTRLRRLGWSANGALAAQAVLRGSYHLYQGLGGFLGNVAMGLVFGRVWQRTNRLWMLVGAHTLIDVVAFLGYAALRGRVSWLP